MTVLRAIGVRTIETRLTTFAELLPGVAAGRWTMSVPLFVTPERAALVAFSRPVWALHDGLIVPAGNPKRLDGYRAIVEAQHARLGVVIGQVQRDTAARCGVPAARISEFRTQQAAVEALLAGAIDAYASTALGNRTFVRESRSDALLAVDVADASASTAAPVGAFSFALSDADLRERFDAYLGGYLGSPAHRRQMAPHGLSAREIDPVAMTSDHASP